MSVEFIGYISNNNSSETIVRSGPVLDAVHIETGLAVHNLEVERGKVVGAAE